MGELNVIKTQRPGTGRNSWSVRLGSEWSCTVKTLGLILKGWVRVILLTESDQWSGDWEEDAEKCKSFLHKCVDQGLTTLFLQSITRKSLSGWGTKWKQFPRQLKSNSYNKRADSVYTHFSICLGWMCYLLGIQHLPATGILETNKTNLSKKHATSESKGFPSVPCREETSLLPEFSNPHLTADQCWTICAVCCTLLAHVRM